MLKRILVVSLLLTCSACAVEAQWEEVSHPPAKYDYIDQMIFDSSRNTLILIGDDRVFEWDGTTWSKTDIPFDSEERLEHFYSVVYCEKINRTLLFGGVDEEGWDGPFVFSGETRLWDGEKWELLPIEGPSPRAAAAIAYDPNRKVVVLFGGENWKENKQFEDTWEFDGSAWHLIKNSGPLPPGSGKLVYNPNSERMLYLPEVGYSNKFYRTLWEWDGTQWTRVGSLPESVYKDELDITSDYKNQQVLFNTRTRRSGSPEIWRMNADYTFERLWFEESFKIDESYIVASDPKSGVLYLYGYNRNPYRKSVWQLDPSNYTPPQQKLWSKLANVTEGPSGKCVLVYDKKNEQIMAFDGAKTWTLEGGIWINHGVSGPGRWGYDFNGKRRKINGRRDYGLIFHDGFDSVMLMGGKWLSDDWLWNGKEWSLLEVKPKNLEPYDSIQAVYDSQSNRVIVQDKYRSNLAYFESWIIKYGTKKRVKSTQNSPSPDYGKWLNLVYDPNKNITYYFDDYSRWELSGRHWREFDNPNPIVFVGLMGSTLVYHPGLKRILLLCGYEGFTNEIGRYHELPRYFNEVRFWNGTYWEILPSATLPTPRKFAGAAYNEKTGTLILAGGIGPNGKPLHDTWRMKLPKKDK